MGPNGVLSPFNWSGRNGHSARLSAGKELAAFLLSAREKYPGAKQFIVCHSHGGNVALYAHRILAQETSDPTNIIALATPFIRIQPRRKSLLIARVGWLIFLALFPMILVLASGQPGVFDALERTLPNPRPGSVNWPLVGVFLGGWAFVVVALYWSIRAYAKRHSRHLLEQLSWPDDGRINLLTASYRWDEARGLLRGLHGATTSFSRRIWNTIGVIVSAFAAYAALTVYAAYFNQNLYESSFIMETTFLGRMPRAISLGLSTATITFLLALVGIVAYLLNIFRGNPYGFGWERPSSTFIVDIQALDSPEGLRTQSEEHYRIPIGAFAKSNKGLAHSLIYEDPRIHQQIVKWITSKGLQRDDGA